jgi:hypothetical protein
LDIPIPLNATGSIAAGNGIAVGLGAGNGAWPKMQFALMRFAFCIQNVVRLCD